MAAEPPPVVVLSGPTAAGKTGASIALARSLDAEIVSVDSGLVYRGLDIGTAKPTAGERGGVPHHLIDVREAWEPYSAAAFVADALRLVDEIRARGRRVLLVGGTLLYVRALERGLAPLPAADAAVRAELVADAARRGWPALHAELARVDPTAAARIHPNDPQRLQRALEVYRLTGVALGELQRRTLPAFAEPLVKLALVPASRAWLHARIALRFDAMLAAGFLDEVRALRRDPRVHAALPAMRSVGYRQAWAALDALDGEPPAASERTVPVAGAALPRPERVPTDRTRLERMASGRPSDPDPSGARTGTRTATIDSRDWVERARAATRQLAKRQLTWLRGMDDLWSVPCDTLDDGERDRMLLAAATARRPARQPGP